MKKLLFLFVLALSVFACEDGIVIKVPTSFTVDYTLPSSAVNSEPNNQFSASREVDLVDFVSEDSEAIQSIKLDKLVYEVSNYNNTSGNVVTMDLIIQTRIDGNTTDILNLTGLVVGNSGEVVAFEDGNPTSLLSAAQVASLEAIMDNLQPFEFVISADFTDDIDSDFDFSLSYDITLSVSQDTAG